MNRKIKKLFLWTGDLAALYLSLLVSLFIRYGENFNISKWQQHFVPFTIVYILWLIVFYVVGLYEPEKAKNNLKFYSLWRRIFNGITQSRALLTNVLMIGRNKETEELIKEIKQKPQLGYRIIGPMDLDE